MNNEEIMKKQLEIIWRYFDLELLDHDTYDDFQLEMHKAKVCDGGCSWCCESGYYDEEE